jgi:predicted RNA polymerase sigma factor
MRLVRCYRPSIHSPRDVWWMTARRASSRSQTQECRNQKVKAWRHEAGAPAEQGVPIAEHEEDDAMVGERVRQLFLGSRPALEINNKGILKRNNGWRNTGLCPSIET